MSTWKSCSHTVQIRAFRYLPSGTESGCPLEIAGPGSEEYLHRRSDDGFFSTSAKPTTDTFATSIIRTMRIFLLFVIQVMEVDSVLLEGTMQN